LQEFYCRESHQMPSDHRWSGHLLHHFALEGWTLDR
jgi:hypothetical protein